MHVHNIMYRNSTKDNENRHKCLKNTEKKAFSKAMRAKIEKVSTELKNCGNGMPKLIKALRIESNES